MKFIYKLNMFLGGANAVAYFAHGHQLFNILAALLCTAIGLVGGE